MHRKSVYKMNCLLASVTSYIRRWADVTVFGDDWCKVYRKSSLLSNVRIIYLYLTTLLCA